MRRTAASALVVVTETVVEAAAPDGVTVAGEKLHEDPVGKPEQVNETGALNPFTGAMEIEAAALCPPVTVCDAGEVATLKSGANVYVTLPTELLKKFEATAMALMVSVFPYAPTPIPFWYEVEFVVGVLPSVV